MLLQQAAIAVAICSNPSCKICTTDGPNPKILFGVGLTRSILYSNIHPIYLFSHNSIQSRHFLSPNRKLKNPGNRNAGDSNRVTPAPTTPLPSPRRQLHGSQRLPNVDTLHRPLSHSTRHRRPEIEHLGIRNGPIRRERRKGESSDGLLLQQILLLHQHRNSDCSDCAGVHTRRSGSKLGLWHLFHCHGDSHIHFLVRHQNLPVQEELRQPHRPDFSGHRGGDQETEAGPSL